MLLVLLAEIIVLIISIFKVRFKNKSLLLEVI